MNALEIARPIALLAMAATILSLLHRMRSRHANAGLVETWKVGFDVSPIATLIWQNGVYVHCNDAAVSIIGAKNKAHALEAGRGRLHPSGSRMVALPPISGRTAARRSRPVDIPLCRVDGTYA
jgi:hypothetical protein